MILSGSSTGDCRKPATAADRNLCGINQGKQQWPKFVDGHGDALQARLLP